MKTLLAILAGALLGGCATAQDPAFHSAYYLDQEYGVAQQHSWDGQVAYPDYRYAERQPVGLEGIDAEKVMDVHNKSFAEKPTEAPVMTFGIVGGK